MTPAGRSPSLRVERALQREGHRLLAGMDEVGRGALAGPVTVGVVVIDETCRTAPQGVRDSKLLAPHARERMVPRIERWAVAHAVGPRAPRRSTRSASSPRSAWRACAPWPRPASAPTSSSSTATTTGSPRRRTSASSRSPRVAGRHPAGDDDDQGRPEVLVGRRGVGAREGDPRRDHGGPGRQHPVYGWVENKGYAAPEHIDALRLHGTCEWHRRSWRLPGTMDDDGAVTDPATDLATDRHRPDASGRAMSSEDLEKYESEAELALYREYRDVVGLFSHVVETERRFYLCNSVDVKVRSDGGEVFFDVTMHDAWVWDIYRPARFAKTVRVVTFKDVNVEELAKSELELPRASSRRPVGLRMSSTGPDAVRAVHSARRRARAGRVPAGLAGPHDDDRGRAQRAGPLRRGPRGALPARPGHGGPRPELALRARRGRRRGARRRLRRHLRGEDAPVLGVRRAGRGRDLRQGDAAAPAGRGLPARAPAGGPARVRIDVVGDAVPARAAGLVRHVVGVGS